MPSGHKHISFVFSRAFRDIFSQRFENEIVVGNKILVPCLDIIMIAFFPKNI